MFEPDHIFNTRGKCQIKFESSLPTATDRAEEGSKNGLRSDLRASKLKKFFGGAKNPPSCCMLLHAVMYSAGPIQFCFRRA